MPLELPSHVEWLFRHHGDRIGTMLGHQNCALDVRDALVVLCKADPSPRNHAVQWLVERLLDGGLLWEDVRSGAGSKVYETLVAFEAHRRTLNGPCRNLSAYSTLGAVWKAVAHLLPRQDDGDVGEPGIRERRRLERGAAREESTILCERPGLTVAVPLTEDAAKWWGRGTRWCTAAREDNAFDHYYGIAPLIVVVMPHAKLQLHLNPDGRFQFMDEADLEISKQWIEANWADIGSLVIWATLRNPGMLHHVPCAMRTREVCMAVVSKDGRVLGHVPHALRDRDMCMAAVRQCGIAIKDVPYHMHDDDMWTQALRSDGLAIIQVVDAMENGDKRMKAVATTGIVLRHVPMEFRDRDLCRTAVDRDGMALEFVPASLLDADICMMAVQRNGLALKHVPRVLHDRDIFMAAVEQDGMALNFIPRTMMDRDLCMVAVRQNVMALEHVSMGLRDERMCLDCVRGNGICLLYVPEEFNNRDLHLLAVSVHGHALQLVPKSLRDKEMCLAAVRSRGWALGFVPYRTRTREICLEAVRRDRDAIQWVPQAEQDDEMLSAVVGSERTWTPEDALDGLAEALSVPSGHSLRVREVIRRLGRQTRLDLEFSKTLISFLLGLL